jgi:hypothetical protein
MAAGRPVVAQPPPRLLKDWPPADVIAFERQGHWEKHCRHPGSNRSQLYLSADPSFGSIRQALNRT